MIKQIITEVIKSENLKDISTEMLESFLENSIANDLLQEIPIVKTLIAAKSIFTSISDRIFVKKAITVLIELKNISSKDRINFLNELDDDFSLGSERILLTIEKLDTYEKCQIFGRLAKLRAQNLINLSNFLRLTKTIQDSYLDELYMIKWLKKNDKNYITEEEYYPLISLGLIFQERSVQQEIRSNHQYSIDDPEFVGAEIEFYFRLTNLGKVLHEIYNDIFH